MLDPDDRIGLIAAFKMLHLALTQLQQAGGIRVRSAYRPLHSQVTILTRVTKSRRS
jgi:hypothetical protein